jgi:hypothetical protein
MSLKSFFRMGISNTHFNVEGTDRIRNGIGSDMTFTMLQASETH